MTRGITLAEWEILNHAVGTAVVVGAPAQLLIDAVAAASTDIHFVVSAATLRLAARRAGRMGLTNVHAATIQEVRKVSGVATLLIGGYPEGDGLIAVMDALLATVIDGGLVVISARDHGIIQRRVELLLASTCRDVRNAPSVVAGERIFIAERAAEGQEDTAPAPSPDPADVTIVTATCGGAPSLVDLGVDVLLRQALPPAVWLIADDEVDATKQVPANVFGLAALSPSQAAILRTSGGGSALAEAFEYVESEYVAFVPANVRLVPGYTRTLARVLEDHPGWAGVAGLVVRPPGAMRPPLRVLTSATMFRVEAVREAGGLGLGDDFEAPYELCRRMRARGRMNRFQVPVVLADTLSDSMEDLRRARQK